MDIIRAIEQEQLKTDLTNFEVGDYVKVHVKIKEGNRERIQIFEGTIIGRRGSGIKETFTVRRITYGVGVERVFPVHSPRVERVEIVRKGKVRRANYFICVTELVRLQKLKQDWLENLKGLNKSPFSFYTFFYTFEVFIII